MKVNTTALAKALTALLPVTGKRTALPVLNTIRVEAKNGVLTLQATNLECFVSLDVECTGKLEAACVPARVFRNVVGFGLDTELSLVKGRLHVKTESSAIEIPVLDAAEFPPCLEVKEVPLAVDCAALATAIDKAGYAFSTDIDRPALQNVGFEVKNGTMHVCTTDGRRLVTARIDCKGEMVFAIPAAEMSQILAALRGESPVIRVSDRSVRVDHGDGFAAARLSEQRFPNFQQVIPNERPIRANIARSEFLAALDLCAGFLTDKCTAIKMTPKPGEVAFSITSEAGAVETAVKGEVEEFEPIAADPDYLRAMLRHMEGDTVAVSYVDNLSPIVVSEGNVTAVVMPMRLN